MASRSHRGSHTQGSCRVFVGACQNSALNKTSGLLAVVLSRHVLWQPLLYITAFNNTAPLKSSSIYWCYKSLIVIIVISYTSMYLTKPTLQHVYTMQSEHYLSESVLAEPPFISHQGKARTNVRRSIVVCRDQLLTWPLNAVQTNSISIVVGKNYLHLIIGILSLCISAHLTPATFKSRLKSHLFSSVYHI